MIQKLGFDQKAGFPSYPGFAIVMRKPCPVCPAVATQRSSDSLGLARSTHPKRLLSRGGKGADCQHLVSA